MEASKELILVVDDDKDVLESTIELAKLVKNEEAEKNLNIARYCLNCSN